MSQRKVTLDQKKVGTERKKHFEYTPKRTIGPFNSCSLGVSHFYSKSLRGT